MKKINNVDKLTDKDLCYQCGTCKSICPTKAIIMERIEKRGLIYPNIDYEKCINCGKCLKVCPINNIDAKENSMPSENVSIEIYKSTDLERFDYTASGGVATEIIKFLFENGKINKAIVVGMDKENPTSGKVYIIDNINYLKSISGSVYQSVSVNEVLDNIEPKDKVAFVGLPCHMRGLNLFLKYNPKLIDTFVIKIGLICTIGRGKHGTTLTLKKSFNVNEDDVKNMIYRYGNPPGNMIVNLKNGNIVSKSCMELYKNTDYIFIPKGCLFCNDLFNEKADITVGDPWGMDKGKNAMAIIRNKNSKDIIRDMNEKKYLAFDSKITSVQCAKTQKHCVNYKINNYHARINAYKKMGISIPNIKNLETVKLSHKEVIGYNLLMYNSLLFNTSYGFKLCNSLPSKILYKYRDIVSGINTKSKLENYDNVK